MLRIVSAALVATLSLTGLHLGSPWSPPAAPGGPANGSTDPSVTVTGGQQATRDMVHDAVDSFGALGLDLPDLEVRIHDDFAGCRGLQGWFQPTPAGAEIDLCLPFEHLVLHELGHAWAHVSMDAADQARFVALIGAPSWDDPDTPWHRRGTELAADAIADALLSNPNPRGHAAELDRFTALTGLTVSLPPAQASAAPTGEIDAADTPDPRRVAAYVAWRAHGNG